MEVVIVFFVFGGFVKRIFFLWEKLNLFSFFFCKYFWIIWFIFCLSLGEVISWISFWLVLNG